MAHHPALQWVSNLHMIGRVAEEAHVLDELGKEDFQQMLGQGPTGKYGQTAPFAEESDKVIDCAADTPHCSIKAEVPYRILDIYGDAARDGSNKYLIQLRDPVARAISSWTSKFDLLSLEEGFVEGDSAGDTRSLAEAIQQGEHGMAALNDCEGKERRLAAPSWDPERQKVMELERCPMRNFLGHSQGLYWAHVAKGMYARQLERWFALVGRENIKVTFLEETAADPVGALASIFEFIGLDLLDEEGEKGLPNREAWESVVATVHNETDEKRKTILDQQVTPELLQSMRDFFASHNAELEELLGRPLPDNWSTVASGSH
ncbi:expressed unknown protein [Ectocarpus siliculosus]|uniref:Uncharacterized protein n=1 Tax=Ectocarpus siliculosus TaxID=2880 RepID=D7G7A7_ECTSI|nr:expressed unknown protein [Ectocarpus siliculosus]|eukprot:CBJ27658.1 expressed unknown protein [Ectocarpus siliculosus]